MTALAPTPPQERIEILDVLRGFALFGVLLMNMQYFVSPSYSSILHSEAARVLDWLGFWFVRMFAESKFYPLFSFLFGYGMAIQMQNAAARGSNFLALYMWRLTILLLIGAFHSIYLWSGDILATYALLGFALLPFRNRSDAFLIAAGVVCLFAVSLALSVAHSGWLPPDWTRAIERAFHDVSEDNQRAYRQALRVMSMFCFGLWAGRNQLLTRRIADARAVYWVCVGSWIAGLSGNLAYVIARERIDPAELSWSWIAALSTLAWAGPLLAVAYAATLVQLSRSSRWRARLAPLAGVGKMALTHYLLQTVLCQALLSRALLGRFGPVHPPMGLLLTVAVFGVQVVTSHYWLRTYRFGPVEWLWRSLTYGELQPMRQRSA